ncbi:hypothetical protein ABBQ38_005857 [Trebouxia sp. C0009 RCD-2024]
MDAPQTVLFRHAHTKQKFTILHLPGTFYAGHEKIMSDRFGNQWQHGVSPMDKERESVLSWVMDFGPQADILQNNGMFLEDFAESQLPKEEILGVHPVTLMGEQTHLRVMPRDDPSELNQHVQGNKWAIKRRVSAAVRGSEEFSRACEERYRIRMQKELEACIANAEPTVICHGYLCQGNKVPNSWLKAQLAKSCLCCRHGVDHKYPPNHPNVYIGDRTETISATPSQPALSADGVEPCTACGAVSTTHWRKGLKGERLCNVCGVRARRSGGVWAPPTTGSTPTKASLQKRQRQQRKQERVQNHTSQASNGAGAPPGPTIDLTLDKENPTKRIKSVTRRLSSDMGVLQQQLQDPIYIE